MLKRLKRLEKFDQQLQAKHKGAKPKLMQGGNGLAGAYGGQGAGGPHFHSQEESQMDLDELAKHIGIKVSQYCRCNHCYRELARLSRSLTSA